MKLHGMHILSDSDKLIFFCTYLFYVCLCLVYVFLCVFVDFK